MGRVGLVRTLKGVILFLAAMAALCYLVIFPDYIREMGTEDANVTWLVTPGIAAVSLSAILDDLHGDRAGQLLLPQKRPLSQRYRLLRPGGHRLLRSRYRDPGGPGGLSGLAPGAGRLRGGLGHRPGGLPAQPPGAEGGGTEIGKRLDDLGGALCQSL